MKYRLTPFHFLALVTTISLVNEIIEVSRIKGDPGLGGLAPYIMLGLTLAILFIDLVIQLIFKKLKTILIIEVSLIGVAAIYYYLKIK